MAQEAQDQPGRDSPPPLSILERAMDSRDNRLEGHAALGVGLRIEEDLDMPDALPGHA
jgi:hypothetical protein